MQSDRHDALRVPEATDVPRATAGRVFSACFKRTSLSGSRLPISVT